MQNEPPLDPRLLADFEVDDRKMELKGGGEGGVRGCGRGGKASKVFGEDGYLENSGGSPNGSSLDTFHRNRRSATFFS